ncbi:MAG: hypothetical protein KBC96_05565 [Armatimonadetes bacterium]|nr:hypothetical protein [Armatimonadota bacterium]
MSKDPARALVLVHILILALFAVGACAQEIPGRVANTELVGTSSLAAPMQMFDGTQDVLFGKNTKGPYTLSWKPIDRNSESVTINNHRVERTIDYQIDYSSGVLAFNSPIPTGSVIKVEYRFNPKTASKNVQGLSLPLSFDLVKRPDRKLQFSALYKQAGADPKQTSDLTVIGLTGDTKIHEGKLSSLLMFSAESGGGGKDAGFLDRAAMQFGGNTDVGGVKLTTSYSRIGEYFAGAKEYKLKPGAEVLDFGAAFKPSDALALSASTRRIEELAGAREGEVTTTNAYSIAYADGNAPKLNVSRTEVEKDRPDADSQRTTTDQVELEHQLSSGVRAVATHQNVVTEAGGSDSRLTTNQLAVDARVSDKIGVKSNLTQRDSSDTGEDTLVKFDIDAAPSKTLSVKAAVARRDTDASGSDATESLRLTAKPSDKLSIEMNVAHQDSELDGSEFGHAMKVLASPLSYLNVQMDWSGRDSEIRGDEQVGMFQLKADPSKMISVSAAIGLKDNDEYRNLTREARLALKPFERTTISGGYSELESDGAVIARVTDVSAATKPADFVELSGGFKQRENRGGEDVNSYRMAMVLDPGGFFKFTGEYEDNPEDKKGVVLRENNRKLGLLTDFGRLKLKGGFTMRDNYLAGKSSEVTEVGVDYKLSSHSMLTTNYKLDQYREQTALCTNVYSLGYSRRVGSDFNLYLGGRMTTYEENRMYMEGKTEYEAQANLGLRF